MKVAAILAAMPSVTSRVENVVGKLFRESEPQKFYHAEFQVQVNDLGVDEQNTPIKKAILWENAEPIPAGDAQDYVLHFKCSAGEVVDKGRVENREYKRGR